VGFGGVFEGGFAPVFDRGGAVPWWRAGGAPAPVAAYQPLGAASLAASYINLANPGTYDAAPGTAPSFNAATGWTFNGSSQYLNTGIAPATQTYTFLVRYTNVNSGGYSYIFGARNSANNRYIGYAYKLDPSTGVGSYLHGPATNIIYLASAQASGVAGIAGKDVYWNGASVSTFAAATWADMAGMRIGTRDTNFGFFGGYVAAFVSYATALTAPQAAAVSAAMAAL
jgi:hypothetical protein